MDMTELHTHIDGDKSDGKKKVEKIKEADGKQVLIVVVKTVLISKLTFGPRSEEDSRADVWVKSVLVRGRS